MTKLQKRYLLDAALGLMLIFEMFYLLTGNFLHEVVGTLFLATVVVHLILAKPWIKASARTVSEKRPFTIANGVRLGLAAALAIAFVLLALSSMLTSNQLLFLTGVDLTGAAYPFWVSVHIVSAYVLCILTLAHVGIHWVSAARAFKIPFDPARREAINAGVASAAAVGAIALGVGGLDSLRAISSQAAAAATSEGIETNLHDMLPETGGDADGSQRRTPDEGDPRGGMDGNGQDGTGRRPGENPESENGAGGRRGSRPDSDSRSDGSAPDSGSRGNGGTPDSGSRGYGETPDSGSRENTAPDSGSRGYGETPDSGSQGDATGGICPLCPKRCPLSAPQCRKPYAAGLI